MEYWVVPWLFIIIIISPSLYLFPHPQAQAQAQAQAQLLSSSSSSHSDEDVGADADADAASLLSFKNSITDDPSGILSSWTLSSFSDFCLWYGVTCHPHSRRVISLNLSSASLSGTFSSALSNLTHLRLLNLSSNRLSGPLPSNLLPSSPLLSSLDLSNNLLSGRIQLLLQHSDSPCPYLTHLKLSTNYLTHEIPVAITKCTNLRTLLLDGNILEGQIPPQLGLLSELRVLDVSRNSLTGRIPEELANCRKLRALVLTNTNLVDSYSSTGNLSLDTARGEFNAFVGAIPSRLLLVPSLQILWAPRANLAGRLPSTHYWTDSCSLRVVNLGQNYITGFLPESINMCRNLTFLDLSSNNLLGHLPLQLPLPCMLYFNISRNQISGALPMFGCDAGFEFDLESEDLLNAYSNIISIWGASQTYSQFGSQNILVQHDFSWNRFAGPLPLFKVGDQLLSAAAKNHRSFSYRLSLNNNKFNGSVPTGMVPQCNDFESFSLNLTSNELSGDIYHSLLVDCVKLTDLEAAQNQISGSLGPAVARLMMLQRVDLRANRLSNSLPDEFGNLKSLKWVLLGGNNLTGQIPSSLGHLTSLIVLDLSHNVLTGSISATLATCLALETVLLDHNHLNGELPSSFSNLSRLTKLDVSFNNLSGHIPHLQHIADCDSFKGNRYLHYCSDWHSSPPAKLPIPLEVRKQIKTRNNALIIALVTCASIVVFALALLVLCLFFGRRKLVALSSMRRKVVVTFADSPAELTYENVVRATASFSIKNLIGTGGFGSTYKAELVPGFLVAVKRLSIGRFQGVQQFDAEIRTLGRIRHRNLVTLVGYYVGESEMLLIYNYLSGGNLETFIHNIDDRAGKRVTWQVIHKIAMDVAQAIAYLHYSCVPRIVHRDIKPSNILLDEQLNAYLSDFGLAKLLEVSETHATTDVAGTFGYVAPEYATTCRVSDKADVYSFGVVLLELMSGKRSLDPSFSEYGNGFNIVAWAKLLIKEGRCSEVFCPGLWETEGEEKEKLLELLRLASTCTVESLSVRPSMKQVHNKLKQLKT